MIRFALVCEAEHAFEGWFRSNADYDEQLAGGLLGCPACGTAAVRKAIMAPALARTDRPPAAPPPATAPVPAAPPAKPPPVPVPAGDRQAWARHVTMLRAIRAQVEATHEKVGDRFPEEVRKMHYGEAPTRDVVGAATPAEAAALLDEGIAIQPLPDLPELDG